MTRWKEEIILCETDLECALRWFSHKQQQWEFWKDEAMLDGKIGHECYAAKQVATWKALGGRADKAILALDKTWNSM